MFTTAYIVAHCIHKINKKVVTFSLNFFPIFVNSYFIYSPAVQMIFRANASRYRRLRRWTTIPGGSSALAFPVPPRALAASLSSGTGCTRDVSLSCSRPDSASSRTAPAAPLPPRRIPRHSAVPIPFRREGGRREPPRSPACCRRIESPAGE